jgi:hypothetical protein
MNRPAACLASVLLLCAALPAAAQKTTSDARQATRDRAVVRCIENRGTDCETREGLREWRRQEQPLTDAEREAAAAARKHREQCAKNKKAAGC